MSDGSGTMAVLLFIVGLIFYFIPALNASRRKHTNSVAVFLLNLFLGWTLVGWVVALVWSASAFSVVDRDDPGEAEHLVMDKYQQLEALASLKERGIITDEEFKKEKAELLGG